MLGLFTQNVLSSEFAQKRFLVPVVLILNFESNALRGVHSFPKKRNAMYFAKINEIYSEFIEGQLACPLLNT